MNVDEYFESTRFLKFKESILTELNNALVNLGSDDPKVRKKGEKTLSSNSRRELGWNCLPIRDWFLDANNQEALFGVIKHESEDKLLAGYLSTLVFFYERYVTHSMWEEIHDASV